MMQFAELIPDDIWDAFASPGQTLGPLAGLLIARWAGHEESEREATAAFNEEAFSPELPEALRLSAWDDPTRHHAGEVAEAMGTTATRSGAGSAAVRHVGRVAPLVTHAAERSPSTCERLYACVTRIDFAKPDGRALAARLFDDVLRTVMIRQGKLVGEFVTPNYDTPIRVAALDDTDWDPFLEPLLAAGCTLDEPARKEIVNWTGGVPLLVCALLQRLWERLGETLQLSKPEIDRAAATVLDDSA